MEIYINRIHKFNLLPNDFDSIIPNMFVNASLKTFGLILVMQGLYYISWKQKFDYPQALRFFNFRKMLIIPYAYFFYRQLKIEFNKYKLAEIPKEIIVTEIKAEPIKKEEPKLPPIIEIKKPEPIIIKEEKKVEPVVVKKVEPIVEKKKPEPRVVPITNGISLSYIIK
jgi:hypothetical protein